jgi:Glutathione peroxidase
MKKLLIIGITVIMFFFKNQAPANYEKVFFDFKIVGITGEKIDFQDYKNKVVLLVNTASYCGFTKQYDDLQKLWEKK